MDGGVFRWHRIELPFALGKFHWVVSLWVLLLGQINQQERDIELIPE